MNVMATTLPRKSRSDTRSPSCDVSVKSGAGPIIGRRSFVLRVMRMRRPRHSSANSSSMQRPASGSCLQLALELVEEAPVRAVGDDLSAEST